MMSLMLLGAGCAPTALECEPLVDVECECMDGQKGSRVCLSGGRLSGVCNCPPAIVVDSGVPDAGAADSGM